MKNKLTIMNKRQEITDEELERFKNFDDLLVKHNQASVGTNKSALKGLKWGLSILVVSIAGLSTFYFTMDEEKEISKNQLGVTNTPLVEAMKTDSVTETVVPTKENESHPQQKSITTTKGKSVVEKETVVPTPTAIYVQAEPIEGYAHLYDYFNTELLYPSVAVKDSIQGVLTVSFTINREGLPENLQFINSLGEAFEEEAKRLILNMPSWKPATLNNEPVPSRLSIPLTFQIRSVRKQTN